MSNMSNKNRLETPIYIVNHSERCQILFSSTSCAETNPLFLKMIKDEKLNMLEVMVRYPDPSLSSHPIQIHQFGKEKADIAKAFMRENPMSQF